MKKLAILVFVFLFVCTCALADSTALYDKALVDDDTLYYSGTIGSAEGVFVMNKDGVGVSSRYGKALRLLSSGDGSILCADDTNLVVLAASGETRTIDVPYVEKAVYADGRFFFGCGSCAADGTDVRMYFDDAEHGFCYYPVAAADGYYYYIDWLENADRVFYEMQEPLCGKLCRIDAATGVTEEISGFGARYLGVENGYVYYERKGYYLLDDQGIDFYKVDVAEGIYRTSLDNFETTQLYSYEGGEVDTGCSFVKGGIIYGQRSDFTTDNWQCEIIRLGTDGKQLPSLTIDNQPVTLYDIVDGVLYCSVCNIEYSDDDYIQRDLLYAIDLTTQSATLINTNAGDLLYYTEEKPAVAVKNGRIYMLVYDTMLNEMVMRSCLPDGSGWLTVG